MPYKDPERKRQWEQEHREQRNARRRAQRLAIRLQKPSVPKTALTRIYIKKPQSIWTVVAKIAGIVLAVGIGLLAGGDGVSAADRIGGTRSC